MAERFNEQNLCMLTKFKEQLEKLETKNSVLFRKVIQKISRLKEMDASSLFSYLSNHNSKKFYNYEGAVSSDLGRHIFKFRLDSGERLLYTYGKYVSYLRSEFADTIILLAIASHDTQSTQSGMESGQSVHSVDEITESDMQDFEIDPETLVLNFSQTEYKLETADEFFIVDVDNVPEENLELLDVILSREQNALIEKFSRKKEPMIITGGAGTGKTLLLSHIFHNFVTVNSGCRSIYFTNSRLLLDNVMSKVRYIHSMYGNDDITAIQNVSFTDISTYLKNFLRQRIGRDISIIGFEDFYRFCMKDGKREKFFTDRNVKARDIPSVYQLWTEIRGCIKGGLSSDWLRTAPINPESVERNKLFKSNLKDLLEHSLVIDNGDGYYLFADEVPQSFKNLRNRCWGDETRREFLDRLLDTYQTLKKTFVRNWQDNVAREPMRDIDEYYNVMGELSDISDRHLKKVCHEFCMEYDRYFRSISDESRLCIDDNELARMVMEQPEFMRNLAGSYDMVVIDEVQDYTDVQVYLISLLARKLLIIAGDQHQIINPSFFHPDKLKFLPKVVENTQSAGGEIETLGINFRSTSVVIRLLNSLISFRQKKIGNMEKRTENPEVILESKENLTHKFRNEIRVVNFDDDDTVNGLFSIFKGNSASFSFVAVLVPDEETKSLYVKRWNFLRTMIFTLSEIKGLEYQFVICCNMFSSSFDVWSRLLSAQGKIRETKYRFIFNQLYVAVSRAVKSITFVESFSRMSPRSSQDRVRQVFMEILGCNIELPHAGVDWQEYITQFKINSSFSSTIKNIENLVYINKYDTAIEQYLELRKMDGVSESSVREIDRLIRGCKEKYVDYLIEDRVELEKGLSFALLLGYDEVVKKNMDRLPQDSPLYRLVRVYTDPGYLARANGFAFRDDLISRLYQECYGDFEGGVFVTDEDVSGFLTRFRMSLSSEIKEEK
ncbi:MAG: UvrD-helicase domain-containing protein [Succinivibrionaceae bacterium]|nr:UvrD-helicase domain-containing protein [Succinivibrionaceae bacterium]